MESEMQLSVTEEELELFPEPYQEIPPEEKQTKRPTIPQKTAEQEDKTTTHTNSPKENPFLLSLKVKPVGSLLYATKRNGFNNKAEQVPEETKTL